MYIASRDGALLEYLPECRGRGALYPRIEPGLSGIGLEIKRDILDGHVTATEYIRGFAAMGQLNVLHPSDVCPGGAGNVQLAGLFASSEADAELFIYQCR